MAIHQSSFGLSGPTGLNGRDLAGELGSMREDVTLRSTQRAKGQGGFAGDMETTIVTTKAEVAFADPTENFEAKDLKGQVVIDVRIRYRSDVVGYWEVVWKGNTYKSLQPAQNLDGRRRFLWLRCGRIESAQVASS